MLLMEMNVVQLSIMLCFSFYCPAAGGGGAAGSGAAYAAPMMAKRAKNTVNFILNSTIWYDCGYELLALLYKKLDSSSKNIHQHQ